MESNHLPLLYQRSTLTNELQGNEVAQPGFEPGSQAYEARVLPLDYRAMPLDYRLEDRLSSISRPCSEVCRGRDLEQKHRREDSNPH